MRKGGAQCRADDGKAQMKSGLGQNRSYTMRDAKKRENEANFLIARDMRIKNDKTKPTSTALNMRIKSDKTKPTPLPATRASRASKVTKTKPIHFSPAEAGPPGNVCHPQTALFSI
jgi:hypothetical protein